MRTGYKVGVGLLGLGIVSMAYSWYMISTNPFGAFGTISTTWIGGGFSIFAGMLTISLTFTYYWYRGRKQMHEDISKMREIAEKSEKASESTQ